MRPIRVAILTEIPAPYRIPLFNTLAARSDVELEVLFLGQVDPTHPYPVYADEFRFRAVFLAGSGVVRSRRWTVLNRGVGRALRGFGPDVLVVGGWNQPAFWQALAALRIRGRPVVGWVESTQRDARRGSPPAELLKRVFVRACTSFAVPGQAAREYLLALGVEPLRIRTAPNAVDTSIFGERVTDERRRRSELRRQLRLEGTTFLFVGRLEREKGVDVLLAAAREVEGTFVVVGAGSEEEALRAAAPANVRFAGWVGRDELPRWYASADVFVLPSRSEQWGMVLNEAAAAGLPIVASEAAGAAWDLVEPGVNGERVPVEDANALAHALTAFLDDDARARAGARSHALAEAFTPTLWAEAIAEIASQAVGYPQTS